MPDNADNTATTIYVCNDCATVFDRTNDTATHCAQCAENYSTCCDCGEEQHNDNIFVVQDENYCQDCYDTNTCSCARCDEQFNNEQLSSVINGDQVCERCIRLHYTQCNNCGEPVRDRDVYTDCQGDHYCEDCFNNAEQTCGDCGGTYSASELLDHGGRCEYCYNNSDDDQDDYDCGRSFDNKYNPTDKIYEYSTKPDWPMYKLPHENTTYMGIELEIEARDDIKTCLPIPALNMTEKSYIWKHDGSLTNGAELVTAPMTHQFIKKSQKFKRLLDTLKNFATSHDNNHCGLHIHVSLPCEPAQRIQFIRKNIIIYLCISEFIKKFSRRKQFTYCAMLDNLENWQNYNDKYIALHKTRKTLEFRVYRGTLNYESFRACLTLTQAQIDYCYLMPLSYFNSRYKEHERHRVLNKIEIEYPKCSLGAEFWQFLQKSNRYTHLIKYITKKKLTNLLINN